jgi:hypothetical protein
VFYQQAAKKLKQENDVLKAENARLRVELETLLNNNNKDNKDKAAAASGSGCSPASLSSTKNGRARKKEVDDCPAPSKRQRTSRSNGTTSSKSKEPAVKLEPDECVQGGGGGEDEDMGSTIILDDRRSLHESTPASDRLSSNESTGPPTPAASFSRSNDLDPQPLSHVSSSSASSNNVLSSLRVVDGFVSLAEDHPPSRTEDGGIVSCGFCEPGGSCLCRDDDYVVRVVVDQDRTHDHHQRRLYHDDSADVGRTTTTTGETTLVPIVIARKNSKSKKDAAVWKFVPVTASDASDNKTATNASQSVCNGDPKTCRACSDDA